MWNLQDTAKNVQSGLIMIIIFASFKIIMNSRKVLDLLLEVSAHWHEMAKGCLKNNNKRSPSEIHVLLYKMCSFDDCSFSSFNWTLKRWPAVVYSPLDFPICWLVDFLWLYEVIYILILHKAPRAMNFQPILIINDAQ